MQTHSQETLSRLLRDGLLRQLAISNTGFVFDPRSGQSFTVNPTGLEALEMLRDGCSLSQAAMRLCDRYNTVPELAESALEAFIQQIGKFLS